MAGRHARTPEGPVFVDPSGRRSTAVRVLGWGVAVLVVGYLLLVAVALVGPPGLSRVAVPGIGPVLPGPGAAGIDGGRTGREAPAAVLERSPSPSRSPAASPRATAVAATATIAPTPRPSPTATPTPTPRRGRPSLAPTPTATASPTAKRTGRPTTQPTREPPGASRRPTRSPG